MKNKAHVINELNEFSSSEIKPCPFCGVEPAVLFWSKNSDGYQEFTLMCENDKCPMAEVSTDISCNVKELIEVWNTRK